MLKFDDFCKSLKSKVEVVDGVERITYFNEEILPDNNMSIRKETLESGSGNNIYKRSMEIFYNVYLKHNSKK